MPDVIPFPNDNTSRYLVKLAHMGTRFGTLEEHEHNYAELVVALEGSAVNVIDGREQEVEAGDVYVLLPGMLHEQHDMRGYRFAIFKFDYDALMREAGDLRKLPGFHLLFSLDAHSAVHPVLDEETRVLVEYMTRAIEPELSGLDAASETVAKDLFLGLVALLSRRCMPSDPARRLRMHVAADTMGYLERHYMETVSLDALAARAGYSRRHFTRLFREAAGSSVNACLMRIRLDAALELLERNEPLSDIAAHCGFSDASALCRAFRKRFGVSPRVYMPK